MKVARVAALSEVFAGLLQGKFFYDGAELRVGYY